MSAPDAKKQKVQADGVPAGEDSSKPLGVSRTPLNETSVSRTPLEQNSAAADGASLTAAAAGSGDGGGVGGAAAVPVASCRGPQMADRKVHDLMRAYYGRLFPHQHMYNWLVYGNDSKHGSADAAFFQRREFCFTLDGDIFVRYQSFKDGAEMKRAIESKCPAKIDIGPVYTVNPAERLKYGATFQPVERELVFDIDLTDYDDVRTCGTGGHICSRCWPLMAVAVQVMDASLRADFGFEHILWVYSGRRGVHAWVCDASVRRLTDEQRASIAAWFGISKGKEGEKMKINILSATLHPTVAAALEVLKEAWETSILPQQKLLEDAGSQEAILRYIPEEDLADAIRRQWAAPAPTRRGGRLKDQEVEPVNINLQRWRMLEELVNERVDIERLKKNNWAVIRPLERAVNDIIFAHTYPRLDVEVSKKMNHLLKAPFCVHPKTGKVCVPFDPAAAADFDPCGVPTVHSLLTELGQQAVAGAAVAGQTASPAPTVKGEEWIRTEMAPSVNYFNTSFLTPLMAANRAELASKARLGAAIGQFGMAW